MKSDLPAEIYLNIFQRLSQQDLKECLYVCKIWNYNAAQVCFQNIVVHQRQIKQFSKSLKLQPNNITRCARKLTFRRSYSRRNCLIATKSLFHLMLSNLPYLTTICLNDPVNDSWYLENLSDVDLNYVVYLQEITINLFSFTSRSSDILQQYYTSLARFKGSITHLHFNHLKSDVCTDNDLLSYLSQFTRLTHLKINKLSSFDRQLPALPLLLGACSRNLRNFYLHDERVDEKLVSHFLGNADYFPAHVTHFHLRLTHLFSSYIEYFIQNIPPRQVTNLTLEIIDDFLPDWVANSPLTIVDKFTTYLGNIKNLEFSIGKELASRGVISLTREAIPQSYSTIRDIMNKIIHGRPMFLELKVCLTGFYRKAETRIQVEKNQHMQLTIKFEDPDWYPANENIDIMDFIAPDNTTSNTKWMANSFYMSKWAGLPLNPVDIAHIFLYMIEQCAQLHHFFITNDNETFAAGPTPRHVSERDIINTDYIDKMIAITKSKSVSQIPPTKENLKYLSFENTRVSKDLLQLLVQQGLEVEKMRFSYCRFEKDDNNNINLTLEESVSNLILDLEAEHHTYMFLEIELHEKCVVYYQSHQKTVKEFRHTISPNYAYNRYKSKKTVVLRIKGTGLSQISVNARYAKNTYIQSLLYPGDHV